MSDNVIPINRGLINKLKAILVKIGAGNEEFNVLLVDNSGMLKSMKIVGFKHEIKLPVNPKFTMEIADDLSSVAINKERIFKFYRQFDGILEYREVT